MKSHSLPGKKEANTFHWTIRHPNLVLAFQLICPAFKAKTNSISRFTVLIKSHIPKLVPRQRNGSLHREISDHFEARTASSQLSPGFIFRRSRLGRIFLASVAQNKIKILITRFSSPDGCWRVFRGWAGRNFCFPSVRNYRCIMPLFPVPNLSW